MSPDENNPSPDIRESNNEERPFPAAWQPLTPRGVAAFARARIGRLLIVQFIVALLVAASVLWFLSTTWFPTIREGISRLPDTGGIENQQLSSPRATTEPLIENRFLAFIIDVNDAGTPGLSSDLRVEFNKRHYALCSLAGCIVRDYPKDLVIPFNRLEVESWWGAWQTMIYCQIGLAVIVWLFATWLVLATVYCPVVRIFAFFKDRQITIIGSWKLSAAALLPAALMVAAGVLLYGIGAIDLIRFLILWGLHLVVAWVYLFVSPLRLPKASDARPPTRNPFGDGKPESRLANPFAAGSDKSAAAALPPSEPT